MLHGTSCATDYQTRQQASLGVDLTTGPEDPSPIRANDAAQGPSVGGDPDLHCVGPDFRRQLGAWASRTPPSGATFQGCQRDGSEGGRRTVHRPLRANDAAQGPSVGGDPDLHCIGPACRRYVGTRGSRARPPAAAFWGVPTPEGLSRVTEGDSRLALGQRGALRPLACPEGARPVAPIGGRTFAAVGSPTRRDPRQPRPESKVTQGPNPPPPRTVPRPTVLRAGRRRRASTSTTPGCAPPPYKKRRKRSSNDWPLARLF
jgi:hypothetical protein